ncbi:GGDEF domain-containing protein [Rhizobium sp. CFBP 8762]|uniref:GGDEF domain-containing protein n=1 Tax=Rhizobium sp. CFBP 8762 TaxID=2775279 RepID=UPI00177C5630|nr:GGDEF domain-containing protein [Rhizobium sp. CFBP 8762]MBD8554817.1 GGDEF domain-containing protein [Rhizobium sp. CFBP 8762]
MFSILESIVALRVQSETYRSQFTPMQFATRLSIFTTVLALLIGAIGQIILELLGLMPYDLYKSMIVAAFMTVIICLPITFWLVYINTRLVESLMISHDEFARLSRTDSMSNLLNRGGFLKQVNAIEGPYALLICDVDNFKRINDTHGHSAGDFVIIELSRRLAAMSSETDAVGRLGGEEFAICIQDDRKNCAQEFGERIRMAIAKEPFQITEHTALIVTVSVGIALRLADEASGDLLRRADKALYQAKENGRNRVEIAPVSMVVINKAG